VGESVLTSGFRDPFHRVGERLHCEEVPIADLAAEFVDEVGAPLSDHPALFARFRVR